MRKGIFVVFIAVIVIAMVMAAAAKEDTGKKVDTQNSGKQNDDKGGGKPNDDKGSNPQGQPFEEIWKAIKDLQDKLNSGVTRAEFNELKARVDSLEGRIGLLEGRVAALEGGCHPVPETCNGIDDNCDGITDNGATCGTGQQCVNGQCVFNSNSECSGILNCIKTCDDASTLCVMQCMGSASSEAQQVFMPLMECGVNYCSGIGTGTQFIGCLEGACSEQLQACTGYQPPECTPSCAGKVCGSDGCSGTCGTCTNNLVCSGGQCITDPCVPNPCKNPPSLEPFCNEEGDYAESVATYSPVGECISSDDVSGTTSCHYDLVVDPCGEFEVCENGKCIAGSNPCVPNPCTNPPEPVCLREGGIDLVRTYSGEGAECSPTSSTEFQCTYPYKNTDCTTLQHCVNAQCI